MGGGELGDTGGGGRRCTGRERRWADPGSGEVVLRVGEIETERAERSRGALTWR